MTRTVLARVAVSLGALSILLAWQTALAPFGAVAPAPGSSASKDPSIVFVGDIMLDRTVAKHAGESGAAALFAGVLSLFKTADARVANLEGAITDNPSVAQVDHTVLHFTFDPRLAQEALEPLGLTAASLANNHSYDFGRAGYESTREYLAQWGIKPFGHPYNARELSTQFVIRGKIFCLVGYHSLYDATTTEVVAQIGELRPMCDKLVVFAHWGDEYKPKAGAQQVAAAHEFIDAGADLVVGAHPHVVQNVEVYKGKAIFYSLGNFMFDQDFSWDTTHGLALRATFGAASSTFELVPVTLHEEEVRVADEADAARVLGAADSLASFTLP